MSVDSVTRMRVCRRTGRTCRTRTSVCVGRINDCSANRRDSRAAVMWLWACGQSCTQSPSIFMCVPRQDFYQEVQHRQTNKLTGGLWIDRGICVPSSGLLSRGTAQTDEQADGWTVD
ncbi:hypothetical protein J6590_036098 [Homalodisca vitripennis]|nr:hypothetical protein J6590_036098 [Homalodisca vitripennis]